MLNKAKVRVLSVSSTVTAVAVAIFTSSAPASAVQLYPSDFNNNRVFQLPMEKLVPTRVPSTLIARKDSKPKVKVQPTKASSMLRDFQPKTYNVGGKKLTVGKNDMRQILTKHQPSAYNRQNQPTKETFLSKKTTARGVVKIMDTVVKQNHQKISSGQTPVWGVHQGKEYELGYDKRNRIIHLHPVKK